MLIFFKPVNARKVQPIVVVDYTRSDEQYDVKEIINRVNVATLVLKKTPDIKNLEIFSLNYRVIYSHSGINPANSLKTSCTIEIDNASSSLINLVNLKQFTKQESAIALESVEKSIIDPQVQFPSCCIILKNGSNVSDNANIERSVIVYSTALNYDGKRVNSSLVLSCASFSSMVIGLNTAVNIEKTKPLIAQIKSSLVKTGYTFKTDPNIETILPKTERYFPPGTLNNIMSSIATDYGLYVNIDDSSKTVTIKSLSPDSKPKNISNKKFCFRGMVPGAKLISTFSVQDYSRGIFETEIEDIQIFDSILIYDDSGASNMFENFIETLPPYGEIKSYMFYVQEYTYTDDRIQTKVRITATNNWVVSNFKLQNFLENAIYKGHF